MIADKRGIKITSEPVADNGKVQLTVSNLSETSIITFHITNESPNLITFTEYTALTKIDWFTVEDERRVNRDRPLLLHAGEATSPQHLQMLKAKKEI